MVAGVPARLEFDPYSYQITEPREDGGPQDARRCHEQISACAVAGKESALKLLDRNVTCSVLVDESALGTVNRSKPGC